MASTANFRMDFSRFDPALREYLKVSKRALPDILNRKAFFIARRAVIETPKANRQKFVVELRRKLRIEVAQRVRFTKHGVKRGRTIVKRPPLAAMIVQARRAAKGEKGLYGADMAEAVNQLISARGRSAAFLKSGWIPAIKALERVVMNKQGAPGGAGESSFRGAKQYGAPKGRATPAVEGFRVKATIENSASARRDKHQALLTYGGPALQRAFDFEAKSMMDEVARRMFEEGKKLGIKTVT